MKKHTTKLTILILVMLIVPMIYTVGDKYILPETYEREGVLVVPILRYSQDPYSKSVVLIEGPGKDESFRVQVPNVQLKPIIDQEESRGTNYDKPARAKVYYQKNFWGAIANERIELAQPGWVRMPK